MVSRPQKPGNIFLFCARDLDRNNEKAEHGVPSMHMTFASPISNTNTRMPVMTSPRASISTQAQARPQTTPASCPRGTSAPPRRILRRDVSALLLTYSGAPEMVDGDVKPNLVVVVSFASAFVS